MLTTLSKPISIPFFDTGIVEGDGVSFSRPVFPGKLDEEMAVVYIDLDYKGVKVDSMTGTVKLSFAEWSAVIESFRCGAD